jgi:hypothetical protein
MMQANHLSSLLLAPTKLTPRTFSLSCRNKQVKHLKSNLIRMLQSRKEFTTTRKRVGSCLLLGLAFAVSGCQGYTIPRTSSTPKLTYRAAETATTSIQMTYDEAPDPTTFREAEILGLRLMQEGNFAEALVGAFGVRDEVGDSHNNPLHVHIFTH